ncbi:TonB-dependent receptor domain-containing protein [Tardiphaga robiniae]|uniref:TonB-dependent receptor domain-containing protein n=1 Tax=Tardiphaga robiniae TaxID=943830 RepID=UPI0032DF2EF8
MFGQTIPNDLSDAVVTKDPVNVDKAPITVSLNRFALWTDHPLQGGPLKGVQIGGGVRYTGASWGDEGNTFRVEGATALDALVAYNYENYRLALNVTNLADTRYVASCYASFGCFYADVRKVVAKLTYRW